MIEIRIEASEINAAMQELFPREYTICVQRAHIAKLEAMIEDKAMNQVETKPEESTVDNL